MHVNSVKTLIRRKDSIDAWLDKEYSFLGNTLLITGNFEPELKLMHTQEITTEVNDNFIINEDTFLSKI